MTAEVINADPVTDVRRIARVMLSYHLSAIPVVDEQDALIGLVSRIDILRAVTSEPPLSLWT
jgi:acetoin utilization protein AcuB